MLPDAIARLLAFSFSRKGLRLVVPAAFLAIAAAGALFALIEDRSIHDGLWWAFVTVTTVGYGDITPTTDAGRLLAVVLMFGGVGFLLLLAGALVEHFVVVEIEEREVMEKLDELSARVDRLTRALEEEARRRDETTV